jgi:hypothetical protein
MSLSGSRVVVASGLLMKNWVISYRNGLRIRLRVIKCRRYKYSVIVTSDSFLKDCKSY